MLENIVSGVIATTRQNAFYGQPRQADILVPERLVQFSFDNNTAEESSLMFVPNRQALRSLSTHTVDEYGVIQSTARTSPRCTRIFCR